MIDNIINFYQSNGMVGFFFWGPVVFNAFVYPFHIWSRVQRDRQAVKDWRKEVKSRKVLAPDTYIPPLFDSDFITVGTIVKYFLLIITPVLNALATIFHAAPIIWEILSKHLGWLLDIKIVNKGKENDRNKGLNGYSEK